MDLVEQGSFLAFFLLEVKDLTQESLPNQAMDHHPWVQQAMGKGQELDPVEQALDPANTGRLDLGLGAVDQEVLVQAVPGQEASDQVVLGQELEVLDQVVLEQEASVQAVPGQEASDQVVPGQELEVLDQAVPVQEASVQVVPGQEASDQMVPGQELEVLDLAVLGQAALDQVVLGQ
uniref:Uncharacterized protein n=1 Tax=Gasterosteus aculeatus TaxID=69293 RepID=G3QB31_GASAC